MSGSFNTPKKETVQSLMENETPSTFEKFVSEGLAEDANLIDEKFFSHIDNSFNIIYKEIKELRKN